MTSASLSWLTAAYLSVLAAEMIGDRSLYAISALVARFRALPVLCGVVVAFMGKALVAVAVGHLVADLPRALLTGITAASFFVSAYLVWRARESRSNATPAPRADWATAASAAFASVFLVEWGDVGQITTAALSARSGAPVAVWLGATLALTTKGLLGITLGIGLRRYLPVRVLRPAAIGICLVMGVISLVIRE